MALMTTIREDHKLNLAADILRAGGSIRLRALGTSMLPSIWPGDVLNIESMAPEYAVLGDIVLVERNHRFFIHRLIEKHNSGWITCGDSLPHNDLPVPPSSLLGKVSAIHRGHRVIVPKARPLLPLRAIAWTLGHCGLLLRLVLRAERLWQDDAFPNFLRRAEKHDTLRHEPHAFGTHES
jgi:hypothetical protein